MIGRVKLLTLLSLLKVKWQTNTRMENNQTVNFVERMVQVASTGVLFLAMCVISFHRLMQRDLRFNRLQWSKHTSYWQLLVAIDWKLFFHSL